jgi:hypothetical protein
MYVLSPMPPTVRNVLLHGLNRRKRQRKGSALKNSDRAVALMGTTAAALVMAVAAAVVTAAPSAAADYPKTTYPRVVTDWGEHYAIVTWYNRSVGVTGSVTDYRPDGIWTLICVQAHVGPNGTGAASGQECRSVENGTRGFNFTIDGSSIVGGWHSVVVWQRIQGLGSVTDVAGSARTRNRPAV